MNGYQYILARQIEWAKNRGIKLVGSSGNHGRPSYTAQLHENLFQPLLREVYQSFQAADGSELGVSDLQGKMQAVHSSSALAVNIFHYWKSISKVSAIAAACGLCRQDSQAPLDIQFEEKYPIHDSFGHHPNIDVVIHCRADAKIQRYAIECKFSEPYGSRRHGGLKEKYLSADVGWQDIPLLRGLAERISPEDTEYRYLHAAQLIKHILGLKRQFGRDGFRLLYLWYNVLGEDGKRHRDEVEKFAILARGDAIRFHALSYQELLSRLANQFRNDHAEYIEYITERYL